MKPKSKRSPLQSFTLVELLVVMGILGILVTVAIPGMSYALRTAHYSASTANMRMIGAGIADYAADHDSELPPWYNYSAGKYWWQNLAPYMGNLGTNDDSGNYRDPGDFSYDGSNDTQIAMTISYGYNYMMMGRSDNEPIGGYPVQRIVNLNQANTLAVADGPNTNCWGFIDYYNNQPDTNRYSGVTPALFLDGHVERMTIGTNFTGPNPYFVRQ